MVARVLFP